MQHQMSMDVIPTTRPHKGGPRLRKNRRIENRWGLQYQIAVQYAALGRQGFPYMPTEPPASLSDEIVECEPLYVCMQCKDCFRFQSSFENHKKRRSWIFGLWCHSCFRTVCTHVSKAGTACSICTRKDSDKRWYLRARGLSKNQKYAAVKVFYNPCQLFEHMKMHSLLSIDVADIMLMPLPIDISDSDWSPKLEIACEALMEYTFLSRTHIMDWLRIHKMESDWWKLIDNDKDDNLIRKIVKGYRGRQLFKIFEKSISDQSIVLTSNTVHNVSESSLDMEFIHISFKDKDEGYNSMNMIPDKNMSEHEDNPCMSNDITFVDCGSISRRFESESSIGSMPRKQITVNKSAQNNLNWRLSDITKINSKKKGTMLKDTSEKGLDEDFVSKQSSKGSAQQHGITQSFVKEVVENSASKSIIETDAGKIMENPVKTNLPLPPKRIMLHKANADNLEQDLQIPMANCSSKILSIQRPKDADITSIISNLPPHLISNNKKLVFLGQDSRGFITFRSKNELTTEKKLNKLVSSNSNIDTLPLRNSCDPNVIKKKQVTSKIVMQNGKKYFIQCPENAASLKDSSSSSITTNASKSVKRLINKHNTPTSTFTSVSKTENISMEQAALLQNDISLLTPSPSPSELSSSSSCELHVKQTLTTQLQKGPPYLISLCTNQKNLFEMISLIKEENGDVYMNIKLSDCIPEEASHDMCELIPKYREEMIDEFYRLDSLELKERIDHLQHVSEEMEKVMDFMSDIVLREKLRSISTFQHILHECLHKRNQDVQDQENNDVLLNEWEAESKKNISQKCPSCNKFMKPKSYIPGFSKISKDDHAYCACYKHICHECLSYQGTSSRFIAHRNYHKKVKPYVCPDCCCKFVTAKFLEVHTWTVCFHTLKKRIFVCKICDIDGFKDMESIARHFAIMHSIIKIVCEDCFKVFPSYHEYRKHYTETHVSVQKQNPIRLVICKLGDEIVRCENYMSYLEKFPGIRKLTWFKCPFCPMITLETKYMTAVLNAHLRDKHLYRLSEVISKEALADIFGAKFLKTNNIDSMYAIANEEVKSCKDNTVVPKIVNTRTITSEIFEHGSQDTDDIWSVNSGGPVPTIISGHVNPERTNKGDDEEKINLPKILDVRSMADLISIEPKTVTETLTETKEKHNSQTSQLEVETEAEDGNEDSSCKKETTMESDRSAVARKCEEEIEKTKETDRSNNESSIFESEKSEMDEVRINSTRQSSGRISDSESVFKANTDSRIKVVDIRKICKPDIIPLVTGELCDTQLGNENIVSIPKPPPLTRIPQHLLELRKAVETETRSRNVAWSKALARKVANRSTSRIAIDGTKDTQVGCLEFLCHLCGERINTSWSVIRTHFSEKHSCECQLAMVTPQLQRLSPDFITGGYRKIISSKKRKSDICLSASKKKRRWTLKKHTETKDANGPDVGLCVEQETAEDGDGNIKCKKCGQRCTDMPDLREHIAANHRLKGRYLICLECGENFVVAPSLQMHLKAFHGIEDPINYMNQNPSYAPDINRDLETEGKTMVANQCHVCMAVFEDKAAVDKHLRVHGMAFLNRKRIEARNALKNTQKQTNVQEDKQSPVKESPKRTARLDKTAEAILEKLNAAI